ncbi:uncharacterized protein LOC116213588 [Punica granatum]|uniref:Uncharacterized protein LOC116213588 n=2 Tax=Punica granatum TaxID=22663 RepID=A0A6P8E3D9_PUNGR|nr:uncharacterized protein LOC116213588 [Punica granatum]XP_031404463.1 uncharacterized protein LOC116213588 [Punica granatum]PKI76772.1 hypothetical protein CRG98_002758 [Punica granatum]
MSVVEASPHLRDFLRIKDDEAGAAFAGRRSEVAGFVLDAALSSEKQPSPLHSGAVSALPASRTLLDIIRDEELNKRPVAVVQGHHGRDQRSWKSFKDRLRLRRSGSHWISTVPVPSSEIPANKTCGSPVSRQGSARFNSEGPVIAEESSHTENPVSVEDEARDDQACSNLSPNSRPSVTLRGSTRFGTLVPISLEPLAWSSSSPEQSPRPQILRHNSTRYTSPLTESPQPLTRSESSPIPRGRSISGDQGMTPPAEEPPRESTRRLSTVLAEERQQSAREAAAAQEAAGDEQPVRMSLMDLLEETDRQMGLEGTRYTVVGNNDEGEEAAVDDEEEDGGRGGRRDDGGGGERNCCICMVRHKGAAFIPCGHTFCRLCSRELWVSRGNCPLCNNYIAEILDIF